MDLFKIQLIKTLYKNRLFPIAAQAVLILFLGAIVYGGLGVSSDDADFLLTLRNTNLSNLLVWSYWWPIIIIIAVLFGRHWCTVCPVEAVTSIASKLGLKKKPGKLLKSGWVITFFFAIVLVFGVHTFAIHRVPERMAVYLIVLVGLSVLAGLIWEKRTFCTYICPVGHLLGLYSLLSMTEWRARWPAVCKNCVSKACIAKKRHYLITERSCTSELFPPKIKDNRQCILCSQCLSSCPWDNLSMRLKKPLSDLHAGVTLKAAEIGFATIACGFVVYEIFVEWKVTKSMLKAAPNAVCSALGIEGAWKGTATALILFVIFPSLFMLVFAAMRKAAGRESLLSSTGSLALALLPVMGAMHVYKALLKTTSRIPYWKGALTDPEGIETASAIKSGSSVLDTSVTSAVSPYLTAAGMLLVLASTALSMGYVARKQETTPAAKAVTSIAVILYAGIFAACLIAWRIL